MGKKIVILGAGESGVGAALLAKAKGYDVFVSEKSKIAEKYKTELSDNNIDFEEGGHSENIVLNADEVIKSPGIPENVSIIQKIKEKNIPLIGEIEFAGRFTKAFMIGVTGSNGKTTTVEWISHILRLAKKDFVLAGNVGNSPCRILVEREPEIFVLELSSFQLDNMHKFKCDIAVITNISPDHLDRYDYKLENYVESKFRIIQSQQESDIFIFPKDDFLLKNGALNKNILSKQLSFSLKNGADSYVDDEFLKISFDDKKFEIPVRDISLKGKHNLFNAMVSSIVAMNLKVDNEIIAEGLRSFKGVEHRLEFVSEIDGVEYINDSKATNIDSAFYALDGVEKPIVWIVGGTDKGNDYAQLLPLVKTKVRSAIFLGVDNTKLISSFGKVIPQWEEAKSMKEAIDISKKFAKSGEVVLLSPACASFDLFKNYEDRGNQFKKYVLELKSI